MSEKKDWVVERNKLVAEVATLRGALEFVSPYLDDVPTEAEMFVEAAIRASRNFVDECLAERDRFMRIVKRLDRLGRIPNCDHLATTPGFKALLKEASTAIEASEGSHEREEDV